jgi:hypothetical protein
MDFGVRAISSLVVASAAVSVVGCITLTPGFGSTTSVGAGCNGNAATPAADFVAACVVADRDRNRPKRLPTFDNASRVFWNVRFGFVADFEASVIFVVRREAIRPVTPSEIPEPNKRDFRCNRVPTGSYTMGSVGPADSAGLTSDFGSTTGFGAGINGNAAAAAADFVAGCVVADRDPNTPKRLPAFDNASRVFWNVRFGFAAEFAASEPSVTSVFRRAGIRPATLSAELEPNSRDFFFNRVTAGSADRVFWIGSTASTGVILPVD